MNYDEHPIDRIYVDWANTLDSAGQDSTGPRERLNNHETVRLLHAVMGLTGEAGELDDMVKKHIFYGKEIDRDNLIEEAGDVLWYVAVLARYCGFATLDEFMSANKAKLTARYGDKWSQDAALNRNTEVEMEAQGEALRFLCGKNEIEGQHELLDPDAELVAVSRPRDLLGRQELLGEFVDDPKLVPASVWCVECPHKYHAFGPCMFCMCRKRTTEFQNTKFVEEPVESVHPYVCPDCLHDAHGETVCLAPVASPGGPLDCRCVLPTEDR